MDLAEKNDQKRDTRFKPGNQAAKGKGSAHVTSKMKELVYAFVEHNLPNLQDVYDGLSPRDRAKILLEAMSFVLPKMQSVSADVNIEDYGVQIQPLIKVYNVGPPLAESEDKIVDV